VRNGAIGVRAEGTRCEQESRGTVGQWRGPQTNARVVPGVGVRVLMVVSAGRNGLLVDGSVRRGSSGDGARLGGYLLSCDIDWQLAKSVFRNTLMLFVFVRSLPKTEVRFTK